MGRKVSAGFHIKFKNKQKESVTREDRVVNGGRLVCRFSCPHFQSFIFFSAYALCKMLEKLHECDVVS